MQTRIRLALAALLTLTAAPALAQQFPPTLPANTVYGRLGVSAGPGQAIPLTTLNSQLQGLHTTPTAITDPPYSAVGDATTNNATHFAATTSSTIKQFFVPQGTYITGNIGLLGKLYFGPGQIQDLTGNYAPGNFSRLLSRPTTAQTRTSGDAFNADLSHVSPEYWSLSAEALAGVPNAPYWNASIIPHYRFANFAGGGSSGSFALITVNAVAGNTTVTVNSTAGWAVDGMTLQFVEQGTYSVDIVTLLSHTATTITFANVNTAVTGLTQSYTANNSQVGPGSRTQMNVVHDRVNFNSAGDSYVWAGTIETGYVPLAGQSNYQFTQTVGLFNGSIGANQSGGYHQLFEWQFNDNGNDIAVIGQVIGYNRTVNTGARNALWVAQMHNGSGSVAIDAGIVFKQKWNTALDTTGADFSSFGGRAINMAINQYIAFNSTQDNSLRYPVWGSLGGDTTLGYNSSAASLQQKVAGVLVYEATAAGSLFVNNLLSATSLRAAGGGLVLTNGSNTTTVTTGTGAGTFTITLPAGTTDFTATGGAGNVVKQLSTGSAFTVAAMSAADMANGTTGSGAIVLTNSPTLTGTLGLSDATFQMQNNADGTKKFALSLASISAGTTRTWTVPDASDTFVGLAATQELTAKTLNASVGKGTWTASGTWTLPAHTLGGTISGGGNQINNVVIGTTTPLAGAFTTLSATGQITSTLATGTAPLVIASTTNVANLNASSLSGATFAAPGAIGGGTPSTGAFTTLTTTSTINSVTLDNTAWTSYTPVISAVAGSITPGACSGASKTIGKTTAVYADCTETTETSGTTGIDITLPNTAASGQYICNAQLNSTHAILTGQIGFSSTGKVTLFTAAGAYPGATGARFFVTCVYQNT